MINCVIDLITWLQPDMIYLNHLAKKWQSHIIIIPKLDKVYCSFSILISNS